jgi:hypothetical protein
MSGVLGAGAEPGRPPGAVGATGVYGACGTVAGGDGLKTGGGGGGTGLTICARATPIAKAAIIAASETAATSVARGRSNPVATIAISLIPLAGRTPFPINRNRGVAPSRQSAIAGIRVLNRGRAKDPDDRNDSRHYGQYRESRRIP